MGSQFLEEIKIKFLQIMQSMSSNKSNFPVKKVMKYVFYVFIVIAIGIYIYSIFFNIKQISIMNESGSKLQEILIKVQEESKNFTQGKTVVVEDNIKINTRDYLYNFYNFSQEISKSQTIPIIFKNVKIDPAKPNNIHIEMTFIKYLSIDKILKYSPEGKTFLKIRNFEAKYEYLQDYDLAFYTIIIDGEITQYEDQLNKTIINEE